MEIRFFRTKNSLCINTLLLQLWTKKQLWLKCSQSLLVYARMVDDLSSADFAVGARCVEECRTLPVDAKKGMK